MLEGEVHDGWGEVRGGKFMLEGEVHVAEGDGGGSCWRGFMMEEGGSFWRGERFMGGSS